MLHLTRLASLLLLLATAPALAQEANTEQEADAPGDDGYVFIQTEAHASLISDAPDSSVFAASRGGALRVGYRWDEWGVFGHIEQNRWLTSETESTLTQGVLNIGAGGDLRIFDDRIRASATAGTCTLLFDTFLDDKGTTGFFFDLRPGGLRWFPLDWLVLEFHPLSFSMMMPVVNTPQILHIEYRTVFITEFQL